MNSTAFVIASAADKRSCPKLQDRAPSEQSKLNERLEENIVEKVNLCWAAASIITGACRYFALRSSLDSRGPRFEDAGLRSNSGALVELLS